MSELQLGAAFCPMIGHDWRRTTQPDLSDFVCHCTGQVRHYDASVLDEPNCPRCGKRPYVHSHLPTLRD